MRFFPTKPLEPVTSILMLAALPCPQLVLDVLQGEQLLLDLLNGEQISITRVELGERGPLAVSVGEVLVIVQVTVVGGNPVEVAKVQGMGAFFICKESLIHLLPVPDTDGPDFALCMKELLHRLGEITYGAGRRLLHQNVPGVCMLVGVEHQIHGLVEGHDEAGHGGLGHRQGLSGLDLLDEQGNNRASGTQYVAVPCSADERLVLCNSSRLCNKDLLHHSLAGPHSVDGIGCLVGGEAYNFLHPCIDAGRQDVVGTDDIGLHRFHGKELTGRNLLQGCCTEDEVHAIECIADAAVVAHIADVVLDLVVLVEVTHIVLLLLVAAEDADLSNIGIQEAFEHGIAEGTGAAGDEDGLISKHEHSFH